MAKRALSDFQSVDIHSNKPKLLFPSINDNNIFGSDINICSKEYAENFSKYKVAKEFWQKYQRSKNIVIIDDYFHKIPIEYISECLSNDATLTIYTGREIIKVRDNLQQIEGKKIILFKIQKKLKIHDRYAILDDELFHFGSTVGGNEEHFTSYSCGWDIQKIKGLLDFLQSRECLQNNLIKEVNL